MSRIPPPRSAIARPTVKRQDENKPNVFRRPITEPKRIAVKRPGEHQVALSEKKQRIGEAPIRRGLTVTENVNVVAKNAGFSEKAKRAALQPISESALVRGSMPAISISSVKQKPGGKTKRPAWDLKGRIQDMEEHVYQQRAENLTLTEQMAIMNESHNQRIAALESANALLHKDVEIKSTLSEEASSQVSKLEKLLREKTEEAERIIKENEKTISDLTNENRNLKNETNALKSNYDILQNTYQQETTALKSSITNLTCSKSGLQTQLDATELLVDSLKEEIKQLTKKLHNKEVECESQKRRISELESKLLDAESIRRKLHNTIQELKGNIRVFCRIRPPLVEELKNNVQLANIDIPTQKVIEIHPVDENSKNQKKFEFTFDFVFSPSTSQTEVFEEISQLVQSSIDGYNVCIFAYGQTGSGKTYTMEGPESLVDFLSSENESHLGMIPRSVQQIFKYIYDLEPRGWTFKVEAFFLEIYNERIQDLLKSDSQSGNMKCEIIKSAGKGNDCLLSNVDASPVTCAEEVYNLLKKARINRAVAATKCNEYSSRSHYVFQLKIFGENSITGEKRDGILNLVDLAGSERVKESGSAGERLVEAKAINKSLSNLGKVIMSLSNKENHIPYRDSKLTHLLANSLGGNSKTLMFVNISPDNNNLNETINSLRFATKVNQCNIGTAQKRVK